MLQKDKVKWQTVTLVEKVLEPARVERGRAANDAMHLDQGQCHVVMRGHMAYFIYIHSF